MTRVYLSSTYSDLTSYREAVYHVLRQMGYDVIAMEDYVALDQRPLDKCLADVAISDLYIGLFAWRYGYIPQTGNPEGKSITELEYCKARTMEKTCLLFLLDEEVDWPRKWTDEITDKVDRGAHINALRQKLGREQRLRALLANHQGFLRDRLDSFVGREAELA
jgi:uncharacterized protein DUF4062